MAAQIAVTSELCHWRAEKIDKPAELQKMSVPANSRSSNSSQSFHQCYFMAGLNC